MTTAQVQASGYIKSLAQARADELMPEGAELEAPYRFIEEELDDAALELLQDAPVNIVYNAAKSGASMVLVVDDKKSVLVLNDAYLRFLRLRLDTWKRPIDSIISAESPDYWKQKNEFTQGTTARPVAALVPYVADTTERTVLDSSVRFTVTELGQFDQGYTFSVVIGANSADTGISAIKRADLQSFQNNFELNTAIASHFENLVPSLATNVLSDGTIVFSSDNPEMVENLEITIAVYKNPKAIFFGIEVFDSGQTVDELITFFVPTVDGYTTNSIQVGTSGFYDKLANAEIISQVINSEEEDFPFTASVSTGNFGEVFLNLEAKENGLKYFVNLSINDPSGLFINRPTGVLSLTPRFEQEAVTSQGAIMKVVNQQSLKAIECYPKGNSIAEFLYVPHLKHYEMPRQLWDALTWLGASRLLYALREYDSANVGRKIYTDLITKLARM